MAEVEIRPAQMQDMLLLFATLRPEDYDEVRAATGPNVRDALVAALELTPDAESAWAGHKLLAVRGTVRTTLDGEPAGCVWMLGTTALKGYRGAHMRLAREYIGEALETYPVLFNYVHAKNLPAVRWLKRLGFTLGPPAPYGWAGEDFHRFEMRRV